MVLSDLKVRYGVSIFFSLRIYVENFPYIDVQHTDEKRRGLRRTVTGRVVQIVESGKDRRGQHANLWHPGAPLRIFIRGEFNLNF